MPSTYFKCIVPGCGINGKINPQEVFFQLPRTMNILEKWAWNMNLPDVVLKPESSRLHYKVCRMHFDDSCFQTPEKKKLNRAVVPTIFNLESAGILSCQESIPARSHELSPTTLTLPGSLENPSDDKMATVPLRSPDVNTLFTPRRTSTKLVTVIQEVDGREYAKGAVPSIFNNDTTANSKKSSKPVESNENDFETQSDKIVEEPEVTPTPILFDSRSADYKEQEVLTTSNKQPDTDCNPLKERIVQNARNTGQCKVEDLESPMKGERNWKLAMNEISALLTKVNILQSQNSRLDRRVRSMKSLLRHYKKTHAR